MTNTGRFAVSELDILCKNTKDAIVQEFYTEIVALCEKFGNSGQSGGSAPYTAAILAETIRKLCLHTPISPITGEDSEWVDVSECSGDKGMFQNTRCSGVFKSTETPAYYIDAIIFKNQQGHCYSTGNVTLNDGSSISSACTIKTFPFTPKTFYIDCIDTEWADREETIKQQGGGWWTMKIKDEEQLKEVWDYYTRIDTLKV